MKSGNRRDGRFYDRWAGFQRLRVEMQQYGIKKIYGFDYGEEPCMMYFYLCGIRKVLRLLENDRKFTIYQKQKEILLDAITGKALEVKPQTKSKKTNKPVPIQIVINMDPDKVLNI